MARRVTHTRAAALAAGVVLLVLAGAGTIAASTLTQPASPAPEVPDRLVEPRPGDNVFWPWTSTDRTVDGRTLAINVIVHGDADQLRRHLTEDRGATWNETQEQEEDVDPDAVDGGVEESPNATVVDWAAARGARRYLYIHSYAFTRDGQNVTVRRPHQAVPYVTEDGTNLAGQWIEETYQLHDGTYFGTRYHIRAYESPFRSDNWTAIQAHSDHWDWFRLRHTVDGTENAQDYVESEFMGRPFVADVWRMYVANEGSGSDGWATVIDLERRGPPSQRPTNGSAADAGDPDRPERWLPAVALSLVAGVACWIPARWRRGFDDRPRRQYSDDDRPCRQRSATDAGGRHESGNPARQRLLWESKSSLSSVVATLAGRLDHEQLVVVSRFGAWGLAFVSVFGLYLAVRAGGIFLEVQFPALSPKVIAAALYPFIAIGLPVCAYVFGRPLDRFHGFALVAFGLSSAVVVDYLYLNVTLLPLDVVVHRFGVAVTLGAIAAGATHQYSREPTVNRWFAAGLLGWIFLLLAPLVGWL